MHCNYFCYTSSTILPLLAQPCKLHTSAASMDYMPHNQMPLLDLHTVATYEPFPRQFAGTRNRTYARLHT